MHLVYIKFTFELIILSLLEETQDLTLSEDGYLEKRKVSEMID